MILVSFTLKQSIKMKAEWLLSFPVSLGNLLKSMPILDVHQESIIIMAFL